MIEIEARLLHGNSEKKFIANEESNSCSHDAGRLVHVY